jgi:hypothetical protein
MRDSTVSLLSQRLASFIRSRSRAAKTGRAVRGVASSATWSVTSSQAGSRARSIIGPRFIRSPAPAAR